MRHDLPCKIEFHGRSYRGRTKDVSFLGVSVVVDRDFDQMNGPALVILKGITIKGWLVGVSRQGGRSVAQFRVESVDKGEEQWQALNLSGW